MITKPQAVALATLVRMIRDDWDQAGIIAAIGKCRDVDLDQAAIALLRLAGNRDLRSPALLSEPGPHWGRGDEAAGPNVRNLDRCPVHRHQDRAHCPDCAAERGPLPDPDRIAQIRCAAGIERHDHRPISDRRPYVPAGPRDQPDLDQLRAVMPDRVSPECAAGKCAGCDGATWDPDLDQEQPDTCGCPCHPWTAQPDPEKELTHA